MLNEDNEKITDFCRRVWSNWSAHGGKNQCEGCPAHWSNRADYPGDADTRTSSYGHRAWYGDGNLTDVRVVILGHEPGPGSIGEEEEDDTNWTQHSFDDAHNPDVTQVPYGAGSLEQTIPLFELVGEAFPTYWTQTKKCNVITGGGSNEDAEKQCVGIGDRNIGYLRRELATVDPEYVIGLGTDVDGLMRDIYQIESVGGTYSRQISAGSSNAGIRNLSVKDANFAYIPTAHPSRGVPKMTKDQLEAEFTGESSASRQYYRLFAEDFIEQVKEGTL